MAKCAFHPDVDTEVSCSNCGRPICPRDMVPTPVGYKCPICAKPEKGQYQFVKPRQWILGGALALLAGTGGAIVLAFFLGGGFFGIIIGYFWGVLTAEAARRGSGGHRGREMAMVAIAAIVIGTLLTFTFVGFRMLIPAIAAVFGAATTLAWSWND